MEKASRLHNAVVKFLSQSSQWSDLRHLYVLAWMVVGLISEGSVNLTKWIVTVHSKAKYAQSTQRRFARWLNNPRINVQRLYSPIIQATLSQWQESILYLSLDTSMLWNQYCLIRISVIHRGRAIPVAWRVIEHDSSSVALSAYADLLKRVSRLMPPGVKIVFLADRGFTDGQLLRYLTTELNWHYRIRVKQDFWFWRPKKGWSQVSNIHLPQGQAILFSGIQVHKTNPIANVSVVLARDNHSQESWYVLSSEKATLQTLREYGFRFDIEENFLDDKSNGFNLESSMIRSSIALSRLCLVLAIATIYLTLQGTAVVASGKRRFVDPHWKRGNSYLRIGWNWVKTALAQGWRLFTNLALNSNFDPFPAIASGKQHQKRFYSIEFQVYSFNYVC